MYIQGWGKTVEEKWAIPRRDHVTEENWLLFDLDFWSNGQASLPGLSLRISGGRYGYMDMQLYKWRSWSVPLLFWFIHHAVEIFVKKPLQLRHCPCPLVHNWCWCVYSLVFLTNAKGGGWRTIFFKNGHLDCCSRLNNSVTNVHHPGVREKSWR